MNPQKADIGYAVSAICIYATIAAVRLASDDGVLWMAAGMIGGTFTWILLQHIALRFLGDRLFGKKGTFGHTLRIILFSALFIACGPVLGAAGMVVVQGYAIGKTARILMQSWQALPPALWLGWLVAIVAAALLAALVHGSRKRDGEGRD